MEEEAGVAGLRDGDVEGVVEHENVVAVEVAAEEPLAVVENEEAHLCFLAAPEIRRFLLWVVHLDSGVKI